MKRRLRGLREIVAAGGMLAVWACGGGEAGRSVEATARAEIEAVTRRWEASLLAGTPDMAVADVFTPDAVRLPSGEPAVQGHEAIVRALEGSAPLREARFTIDDLEVDGTLAFANGTYRVQGPDGVELSGKFLEVWKHTPAGWRIHRVMWD
ncbi:YybH family protein [Candidatus Palauibacter sp.]|uniref:YybH family protein n=1 Tax=Candidatus Palauibacter sp. TaxID=3101350 RepID=UPI003B024D3E